MSSDHMFADPLTERLVAFVRGIGIDVSAAALPDKTVLPGPTSAMARSWSMRRA